MMIESILTFAAEIVSEIMSGYLADHYGRLKVLQGSGFMGGLGFILYVLIDNPSIKSILVFATSFGFAASFNLIFLYSPEIFPTSIRSTVMGFLYFMSRIGALVVPSVSRIVSKPPLMFGFLSLISSYLCSFLTETLGREIEDDMPEIIGKKEFMTGKNISRKMSSFSKLSENDSIVSEKYFKTYIWGEIFTIYSTFNDIK